ncbi:hypothetical protein JCM11491_002085 [Sporobolomyces phaffii]
MSPVDLDRLAASKTADFSRVMRDTGKSARQLLDEYYTEYKHQDQDHTVKAFDALFDAAVVQHAFKVPCAHIKGPEGATYYEYERESGRYFRIKTSELILELIGLQDERIKSHTPEGWSIQRSLPHRIEQTHGINRAAWIRAHNRF